MSEMVERHIQIIDEKEYNKLCVVVFAYQPFVVNTIH